MNHGRPLYWHRMTALWLLLVPLAHAVTTEADVKAAFIYNFTKFVEWPLTALADNAPLQLCVLGKDDTSPRLLQLQGREAQGHPLQVRQLAHPDELAGCHVMYIARGHARLLPPNHKLFSGNGLLTVSDTPGFVRQGGMIELFVESSRVQFMVNVDNAQQADLKISARMLQLARIPRQGEK